MRTVAVVGVVGVLCGVACVWGQGELLPNGGFEMGEKNPLGWQLAKAAGGEWAKTSGADGGAALMVSGDGASDSAWLSDAVSFLPAHAYRLSFSARGEEAGGGTVVCGPSFVNVDIGTPGLLWKRYTAVFATPTRKDELAAPVRLGQWQQKGRVFFDDASVVPVEPIHATFGEIVLGEGEKLENSTYAFVAPFDSESHNASRPLLGHTASFNTDRWCFGEGGQVTYRHAVAGRKLLSCEAELTCNYYVSGRVVVDVSTNLQGGWVHAGVVTNTGSVKVGIPAEMLPAEAVFVRLRGAKAPCCLQVHGYAFRGAVDGEPSPPCVGATRYIESTSYGHRVIVRVKGLGDVLPGGDNWVSLRVQNAGAVPWPSVVQVVFSKPGEAAKTNVSAIAIPPSGAFDLRVPYEVPGVGQWVMSIAVSNALSARTEVTVPSFYDDSYGEVIPVNTAKLCLWRASSGWKIPRARALPRVIAKSLAMRVARNEWEALQLVVAPKEALSNVTVSVAELAYGRARIPRENVEVLRVGYVPVAVKTDATGVLADWPDPLLPQDVPAQLEAGRMQPYWIRVKAPKGIPAGIYRGLVTVTADGVKATTILNVEVYDFELPDTMTCQTSFGFRPQTVWRYQGLCDDAQRREVLDKYMRSLSEHHLSPYNPAPMDGWHVAWRGLNPWLGGVIDTREKAEGRGSLYIGDESERENVHAAYECAVPLPPKGVKVAFRHKTTKGQKFLLSLNYQRADGSWIPGHNTDLPVQGGAEWQAYEKTVSAFPAEAAACRFTFYAAGYQEPGTATGGLWVDSLSIVDAATGRELVKGGAFEPIDVRAAEPVFDWGAWDAAMAYAFTNYHFNSFVMHVDGLGGGTFQGRTEPSFLGFQEDSPEYDVLLGKYLKGIEGHLREKGWLDRAYVYWFDEPDPKDYAFVMRGFAKLKKHAPGLRRMLTEQVEKDLVGGPNLWVPLTPSLKVEGTEERRAAGDQFWWYVCCGPKAPYATEFIDHPGTEMRVWLWQTWAERVTGVLIWETDYWTSGTAYTDPKQPQNPYQDAMSWVEDGSLAPGTRRPWGNGDGRFVYPPPVAADGRPSSPVLAGPVDSVRLELLRDGIEDYEYFALLKRLLAEKGPRLDADSRERYGRLLTVPDDVSHGLTQFTFGPEPIEAHRDKLARAIAELMKR